MDTEVLRWIIVIFNAIKVTVVFAFLYKHRYSKFITLPIFFAWEGIININQEFCFLHGFEQVMLFVWGLAIYIFFVEGKAIDTLITCQCYSLIFSISGTAAIAGVTFLYGQITGMKSEAWLSGPNMRVADFWIYISCVLTFTIVSYYITKQLVPKIKAMSRKFKIPVFTCVYILPAVITIASYFSYTTKEGQASSHVMVAGYAILIFGATIISIIMIATMLGRIKTEQKVLKEEIEHQMLYYEQVIAIQENLREIKHDLANMMVVGGDKYKQSVINYCNTVKTELDIDIEKSSGGGYYEHRNHKISNRNSGRDASADSWGGRP